MLGLWTVHDTYIYRYNTCLYIKWTIRLQSLNDMDNKTNSAVKNIHGQPCTLLNKLPTTTFLSIEHVKIAGSKLENKILELDFSFKI